MSFDYSEISLSGHTRWEDEEDALHTRKRNGRYSQGRHCPECGRLMTNDAKRCRDCSSVVRGDARRQRNNAEAGMRRLESVDEMMDAVLERLCEEGTDD